MVNGTIDKGTWLYIIKRRIKDQGGESKAEQRTDGDHTDYIHGLLFKVITIPPYVSQRHTGAALGPQPSLP